ncbi:MAG: hypothetical protein LBF58_06110 [Deltaproteobacteria bacterium]|jgi:hypothetical protein|nr:hypothetical protein [Deltaproteobacteria bacterium]
MNKPLAFLLSSLLALLAAGCAMPKQANDIVLAPIPDGWRALVLTALAPRATEDLVTYDPGQVAFQDEPRPCVFSPTEKAEGDGLLKGHCGTLTVVPKGRTRLPPANYMYIVQESGEIAFIRQD